MSLTERIATEGARLAAACTACGACVRACPMLPHAPGTAGAEAGTVAAGMRAVLRGEAAEPAGLAWIAACTRSALCNTACPEQLDVAFMLRLAGMRAKGALGEAPRIPVKEDPQWSARVKAFARLTMTEEEQARWL